MSYISVFSTRGRSPPLRKSFILLPCASVIRLVALTTQAHQVVEVIRLVWSLISRQYVMHRRRRHNLAFGYTPLTLVVITTQRLRSQPQPSTTLVVHAYHLLFPRIRKPGQAFAQSGKEGMGFVERSRQPHPVRFFSQHNNITGFFYHVQSFTIILYHLLSFTIIFYPILFETPMKKPPFQLASVNYGLLFNRSANDNSPSLFLCKRSYSLIAFSNLSISEK